MRASNVAVALTTIALLVAGGRPIGQGALAQIGLTEAAARTFVLNEIKGPALDRRSAIAIAGTRAFLKLPPSARGPAATALFAWAKSYVNSPAFSASYHGYRKGRIPPGRQYALTVDEELKKDTDEQLAGLEQMRQGIASMPPADQQKILASLKEAQARLADPALLTARRAALEAERAQASGNDTELAQRVETETPADPQKLFARRLREFLDATQDVNVSARTIRLTGGADGIEFIDKVDRRRHWMWQAATIVGPEATTAARAAAESWLKEIDR